MNQTEAQHIINGLNRAGLVHAMEGQSAIWADALSDIRYGDAEEAARALNRTRTSADRWVTPGDIREAVKVVRRKRLDDALANGGMRIAPPESIDPDDWAAQQQWTRTFRTALADGSPIEVADAIACDQLGATRPQIEAPRPVDALVATTAQRMPRIPRNGDAA